MVLPAGVNKAFGLEQALKGMRLSTHNTVGVGDAENDHAFLQVCEFSAAVANALPSLKEHVDLVLPANHGAGVELLIDHILSDDLSLEPWLYGKNPGVSAVAVLLAAVFWMWLWGTAGLLLATPLTVCVLVIGKHVPQLSFFDILLGTEPVFEPHVRIYQRLLAGDQEEATILFEGFLQQKSEVDVYDTVLIPALAMAETHWQLGDLTEGRHNFIMQSLREMIQDRFERLQETDLKKHTIVTPEIPEAATRADQSNPLVLSILCLPSRTEADEITAAMLSQVLGSDGSHVKTTSLVSMAAGEFDVGDEFTADVVFLSATPPAAMMHARHLCRRLRSKLPDVKIFAGLWHVQGDLIKFQELIGCGSTVVATLADAQLQIQQLSKSRTQAAH
jgi:hypothetical protein